MVGYTLRQERERQELSIEDIEQGTSIRALYIEAIEDGEYDKLPGTVYTKGFIKNYPPTSPNFLPRRRRKLLPKTPNRIPINPSKSNPSSPKRNRWDIPFRKDKIARRAC